MSELVNAGDAQIPPVIRLNHADAYEIWLRWRALDRRFLPSQLLTEPAALLDDMLLLDSVFDAMQRQIKK